MNITLDIEDDVLAAVEELAALEEISAGEVLSRLARQVLIRKDVPLPLERSSVGLPVIPRRGNIVTNEHVNVIREIEGI